MESRGRLPRQHRIDELKGTGAAFTFGDGHAFEFDRADQRFAVSGLPLEIRSHVAVPASAITPGKQFMFSVEHKGALLDFFIDDKLLQTVKYDSEMGVVGFAPKQGTMRIRSFGVSQMWPWPRATPPQTNAPSPTTIPRALQQIICLDVAGK